MDLTPNDIASVDAGYWATRLNKIRLQAGYYSYAGREYLKEVISSEARRLALMKGTQGGASLTIQLRCFHGMIYKRYRRGVLYMFPTTDDVHEFSKATLAPLIASNPTSIGRYVKNVKGGTDTTSLKQVNGANFFMRGAGLTKIIEGIGESTKMKGISSDLVVFDEVELMDSEAIAKALGRMGASVDDEDNPIANEVYIGNPGIPGRGIDEIFHKSDQRHWFRRCGCGEWTCAELTFPDCVKIRHDGTGYIGCMKCGKEVFVRDGKWVPAERDNSDYMHGYRWSQLTSPSPYNPADILEEYTNPPEGNLADVYRLKLGLPYVATEDQLTTAQVLSRCGPFIMPTKDPGPCAFGLDVGKTKRLVIGKRIGRKSYEIVKVARLSSWDDIATMVMNFNCKSGVVDARPYEDEARRFQKSLKMRIFLCEYSETTPAEANFNPKTGIVKVNRTEICDSTHNLVAEDGLLTIPRNCDEIQVFAKEVCNPAKILEINKKTKQALYRYKGTEDHYRHALNYLLLAARKIGRADPYRKKKKHRKVMNDYARI